MDNAHAQEEPIKENHVVSIYVENEGLKYTLDGAKGLFLTFLISLG